jgi:hypothetical protein
MAACRSALPLLVLVYPSQHCALATLAKHLDEPVGAIVAGIIAVFLWYHQRKTIQYLREQRYQGWPERNSTNACGLTDIRFDEQTELSP